MRALNDLERSLAETTLKMHKILRQEVAPRRQDGAADALTVSITPLLNEYLPLLVSTTRSLLMRVSKPSRFKRYTSVFLRWFVTTFVVFVITLVAGKYIYEYWIPKLYAATAKVQASATDADGHVLRFTFGSSVIQTEFGNVRSPETLLPVIETLHLDQLWARRGNKSGKEGLSQEEALAYLNKNLDFKVGKNGVDITFSSDDPKQAAQIANAIADQIKMARVRAQARQGSWMMSTFVPVVTRAQVPTDAIWPNRLYCFGITVLVAALFSVVAGCFVEVILLFVRAAEGEHS